MVAVAVHRTLPGSELHFSKLELISGPPVAAPSYQGQTKYDQTNNILYIAIGTSTLADWVTESSTFNVSDESATTYSASSGDNGTIFTMTNAGARTFTLPANPIDRYFIGVQDGSSAYTANITIDAGGNQFPDGSSTYTISSDNGSVLLIYDISITTWVIAASNAGLQPTFSRVQAKSGSALHIQTNDTNGILLDVNSVNAVNLTTTIAEIKKTFLLDDVTDNTKQLTFDLSGGTTGTKTTITPSQTANRVLTTPDITDTFVTKNTTDILTNKSFNDTTTMLAANQLNFNNSGNTFHTSLKAGANAANLDMTLPIAAPLAGQVLYSTDTAGTLGFTTVDTISQLVVSTATSIDALPSSSTSIVIVGSDATTLRGIVAGVGGQELTIINDSNVYITISNDDVSVPVANRILNGRSLNLSLAPGFALKFQYESDITSWRCISQIAANCIVGGLVAPSAYFIGEQIRANNGSGLSHSGAGWLPLVSIQLSAGIWDVSSVTYLDSIGSISECGISTDAVVVGPEPSDKVLGDNFLKFGQVNNSGWASIPAYRVSVSSMTWYYLQVFCNSSYIAYGRISATRVG